VLRRKDFKYYEWKYNAISFNKFNPKRINGNEFTDMIMAGVWDNGTMLKYLTDTGLIATRKFI
jgi:hypothetical protein